MSQVDNFETLSNADLREKCKEHGLVNVPVTNSTRSVLIKKLRATISGSPALGSKKSSNRRETVHGSKVYPSIEEVKAATGDKYNVALSGDRSPGRTANRRTIAATPITMTNKQATLATAPIINVSTTATTSSPVTVRRPAREQTMQQTPVDVANHPNVISERDANIIMAAAKRVEKLGTYKTNDAVDMYGRNRSSRSSSLSKTGVLTTSYVQEIAPIPTEPIYIEDDDEEDGEVVDSDEAIDAIAQTRQHFNQYGSQVPQSGARNMLTNTFAAPKLYSSPAQSTRYTLDSSTATSRYSNMQSNVPNYYAPSMARQSTNLYSSTLRSMPPPAPVGKVSASEAAYYTDDTDTNNEDEPIKTPFLSNFTRNLERMKAEPLVGGSIVADSELARRYTRNTKTYESPLRRPKINDNGGVSLGEVFNALDQKYNIKRNFMLLLLLMLLVFLFVLFWQ